MKNDFPKQPITIYHYDKDNKTYERYVKEASFRQTSILNRNKTGTTNYDNVLIRIFDVDGYKNTWEIAKGDVIVDKEVDDVVLTTPLTDLQKKYGVDSVFQVSSIDKNIYGIELDHIKIGAR